MQISKAGSKMVTMNLCIRKTPMERTAKTRVADLRDFNSKPSSSLIRTPLILAGTPNLYRGKSLFRVYPNSRINLQHPSGDRLSQKLLLGGISTLDEPDQGYILMRPVWEGSPDRYR